MSNTEKPLVTFALFAYNQEQFIREAVEGAFAQTYEPLEIILSDDCSTDRTFEIMEEMAAGYEGPHSVTTNRNARNLNVGAHVNVINKLAKGELVVAAAGDDVSRFDRVSLLVALWLKTEKQAGLLHSAAHVINRQGEVLGIRHCRNLEALASLDSAVVSNARVIGATEAWPKQLFATFGDLRNDVVHEDIALSFRALLAGRPVEHVDQPLVYYRQGIGITSTYSGPSSKNSAARRRLLGRLRADAQQRLDDLAIVPNSHHKAIALKSLYKYETALRFEEGMPGPAEFVSMISKVGLVFVGRMFLKRLVNLWMGNQ